MKIRCYLFLSDERVLPPMDNEEVVKEFNELIESGENATLRVIAKKGKHYKQWSVKSKTDSNLLKAIKNSFNEDLKCGVELDTVSDLVLIDKQGEVYECQNCKSLIQWELQYEELRWIERFCYDCKTLLELTEEENETN